MFQQHTMGAPGGQSFVTTGSGYAIGGTATPTMSNASSTGGANTGNYGPETRAKSTILLYCQKN
jgi:hypothetical protein